MTDLINCIDVDVDGREFIRCAYCGERTNTLPPKHWDRLSPLYCTAHASLQGRDPQFVIPRAIGEAVADLMRPASDLIDWSLPEITDLAGYLLPGTVAYACAFPKGGKTTFLSNQMAHWDRTGRRVWAMPTESRPKGLLTRLACFRVGVAPDEAMSRRLRVRADGGDDLARRQLAHLIAEFDRMLAGVESDGSNFAIEPAPRLTRSTFRRSCQAAAEGGYELVVVDHVDHIGADPGTGESGYAASEGVQHDALEFAETFDVAVLLMSQFNTRVAKDPLAMFKRPQTDWLWMKGVKDQVATSMFGIYRPMMPDIDDALIQRVRTGDEEPWKIALPNTMGLADMASRFGGGKIGRTTHLQYDHGILRSLPLGDAFTIEAAYNGIHTGSPSDRPARGVR